MPKFSIIIPCYKQAHFLDDALDSVCKQTFPDWEAIVVDDGSPDDVTGVVNQWILRDKRIRLLSQQNSGLSAARNAGIAAAIGNYVTLLDADDKYSPDYLKTVLELFQKGFELVATGYTYFNTSRSIQRSVSLSQSLNFREILSGNLFPPVAVAFNKSILNTTKAFDTSLKSAEDWDMWIRMYRSGISLAVISDSMVYYRISDNSMSRQPFTMYNAMKEVAKRACSIDNRLDKNVEIDLQAVKALPNTIKKILMMCMGVAVMQGKISEAIALMVKEKEENSLEYRAIDFRDMCSYLSFRYLVSPDDLIWVQDKLKPLFTIFFHELPISEVDKKKAHSQVFSIHQRLINKQKWGFISPLINQFS